jgi:diguanylate cyclase (GGDEF)-like protein/PAS domain S-box-containing protein
MNPHHLAARGDHAGLWDWNLATNRVHFSPRWISMVGSDEHLVGNSPEAWLTRVHPDDDAEVRRQIDEHLEGGTSEFDLPHRLLHRDGTYRWTSCHGVVVRNESGRAVRVMGCHSDVTAEKVADALTGLPNRLLFIDHLTRAIERARRNPAHHFAVLLVDLGRARPHDDDADQQTADPVLTAAARRLETCLRTADGVANLSRDHMVARIRGDEFAILLDGLAEVGDARVVADRVLGELLSSFMVGGDEVMLASSIGVAVSATGYTQAEAVVRDADTAMHRARLLGRGRCEVFDTAILKSAQTELQLDTDFMEALARGEFVLYFQPVVALDTNRVSGFEALVRWQHPTRGLVSPAEFIPLAEKTGFIVPLGLWTLRSACLQLKAWQEDGTAAGDVWVSVNLSTPQFNQPSLADDIAGALRDAGLPARCLVVELTEGVAMENPAAVKGLLMQLRIMGVRIALDDFGTGQSSLAYLHQFPADKLKLDRSFVCDMETRADVRDIVAAVTGLAHRLGLEVIAEGVETDGQLALVRSLECEYVQGFVFSRPVDKERAAALLRTGFTPPPAAEQAPGQPTASEAAPNERGTTFETTRRRPRVSNALYVSAAVVITVALSGVVNRFANRPEAPATATPFSALVTPTVTSAIEPERAAASAATSARPATKPIAYSFALVHKHALRGCKGQFTVTSRGVAFVPDNQEDRAKDSFVFPFSEFRATVSGDELTVKSRARTYRFKAPDGVGKDEGLASLQKVADRISRLRPAAPAR